MSLTILKRAWETPCRTHTEKLVLIALADNADDSGLCWPSIDTLAKKSDLSRQGVIDQIKSLIETGKITASKTLGRATRYIVLPVNRADQSTALTSQRELLPPVNRADPRQSTALTTPVNRVDPNSKEPSVEPSVEPSRRFRPKLEEVKAFCAENGISASDAEWFFYKSEGNGWTNGGKPIKDWKATLRSWKSAKYLPSQKNETRKSDYPGGSKTVSESRNAVIAGATDPKREATFLAAVAVAAGNGMAKKIPEHGSNLSRGSGGGS